jgi:hypothetical protein
MSLYQNLTQHLTSFLDETDAILGGLEHPERIDVAYEIDRMVQDLAGGIVARIVAMEREQYEKEKERPHDGKSWGTPGCEAP